MIDVVVLDCRSFNVPLVGEGTISYPGNSDPELDKVSREIAIKEVALDFAPWVEVAGTVTE